MWNVGVAVANQLLQVRLRHAVSDQLCAVLVRCHITESQRKESRSRLAALVLSMTKSARSLAARVVAEVPGASPATVVKPPGPLLCGEARVSSGPGELKNRRPRIWRSSQPVVLAPHVVEALACLDVE